MDEENSKRKTSVKEAWEESYNQKSKELKIEEKKLSGKYDFDFSQASLKQTLKFTDSVKRLINIFRSKRFSDKTLENLYRRYFLKVDQSSQSNMQLLSIVVCLLLIVLFYVNGMISPIRGIVLGIVILLFVILEILLYYIQLDYLTLQIISHVAVLLLFVVVCIETLDPKPRDVSDGLWITVFFVYMIYSGIPVGMTVAVLSGILLPAIQLSVSVHLTNHQLDNTDR
ncbi:unnamed protein product, partial [Candidula unifasciata]